MSKQFECNVEEVFDNFSKLATEDMRKSVKVAIARGAKVLQEQTKANLAGKIRTRGHKHWRDGKVIEYNDTIDEGVRRTRVYENYDGDYEAKVHVLGTRDSESGTYRLRFLEAGTKDRIQTQRKGKKLKKSIDLRSIPGYRFFQAAKGEVLPEIKQIYLEEINKSIQRINSK